MNARPRVLAVCATAGVRRFFEAALSHQSYDLLFESRAQDVQEFARWAQPQIVFLALPDPQDNTILCQQLRAVPDLMYAAIATVSLPFVDANAGRQVGCAEDAVQGQLVMQRVRAFASRHAHRLAAATQRVHIAPPGAPAQSAVRATPLLQGVADVSSLASHR